METNDNNVTVFTDSIVFETIKDLSSRAELGLKKYGTTMDREDLTSSDWSEHAYQEALDFALYLKRLKKDMLALEEELKASKLEIEFLRNELESVKFFSTKDDVDMKNLLIGGTGIAYCTTESKPNPSTVVSTTDTKQRIKPYAWHR